MSIRKLPHFCFSTMASLQRGQVDMFVNITGASEAEARAKLQAFRGDINAAVDSYLSERDNSVASVRLEEAHTSDWMDDNVLPPRHQTAAQPFYPVPTARSWSSGLPSIMGFGFEGMMASRFPYRGTSPFVTQPRDVREVPIDWKDEEPRVRSNEGLVIEEISATDETWPASELHPHIISSDDDASRPLSRTFRRDEGRPRSDGSMMGSDSRMKQGNANGPLVVEVTDRLTINEGDEVEDEMLKAALEASQKEMTGKALSEKSSIAGMRGSPDDDEDDDFVRAISLSLKELEKQKAVKRATLPEEPDVKNENAVTIMLRLPDGARQGRRFLKTEPLQGLIDFLDVSCGRLPGSYQLVRPYPRRAFSDTERGSSFQELGLDSKYETVFLEDI
ncbi:hypothetical protein L7F22_029867 [Adiantum nelumboides]|nr:hypothetical protein [Adiantum nelumboides]